MDSIKKILIEAIAIILGESAFCRIFHPDIFRDGINRIDLRIFMHWTTLIAIIIPVVVFSIFRIIFSKKKLTQKSISKDSKTPDAPVPADDDFVATDEFICPKCFTKIKGLEPKDSKKKCPNCRNDMDITERYYDKLSFFKKENIKWREMTPKEKEAFLKYMHQAGQNDIVLVDEYQCPVHQEVTGKHNNEKCLKCGKQMKFIETKHAARWEAEEAGEVWRSMTEDEKKMWTINGVTI